MPTQYSGNGHYYQVIDQYMTWDQAKSHAETLSHNGQQGYLATVTSSGENSFVYNLARSDLSYYSGWDEGMFWYNSFIPSLSKINNFLYSSNAANK